MGAIVPGQSHKTLTFKVTWRHRSGDHLIRHMPFPISGPLETEPLSITVFAPKTCARTPQRRRHTTQVILCSVSCNELQWTDNKCIYHDGNAAFTVHQVCYKFYDVEPAWELVIIKLTVSMSNICAISIYLAGRSHNNNNNNNNLSVTVEHYSPTLPE